MIIRNAQMEELGKAALRAFEDEMVRHLAEFSPPLFRVIKEDQMREAVRFGIKQAGNHGFSLQGPIRLYLELMLLFGSHFDTDPQYPWAGEILKDQDSVPEMQRAEKLYEKTLDYQETVSGEGAANTRRALKDLLDFSRKPTTYSLPELPGVIRQEMHRIFPEKAAYIGEEGINALLSHGTAEARKQGFSNARGETLIIVLMFAFGYGCTDDLLYPWIARTLKDEKIVGAAARADRLEKKAVTWLEHVLENTGKGE